MRFRTLKGLDIRMCPIRHREERRGRAHLFICPPAGYLEWYLRSAWALLLFDDETLADARGTRDSVALAKPTERARYKKASRRTDDGWPLHCLDILGRRTRDSLPQHLSCSGRSLGLCPVSCSPSRHRFSAAPHTSSKRSQYREPRGLKFLHLINQLNPI